MLLKANLLIPNRIKKPIQNPTMRWIFQLFEGVNFATIYSDGVLKLFTASLNELRTEVVELLGGNVFKIYHSSQIKG